MSPDLASVKHFCQHIHTANPACCTDQHREKTMPWRVPMPQTWHSHKLEQQELEICSFSGCSVMKAVGGWRKEKTLMLWEHCSAVAKTPVFYQCSYLSQMQATALYGPLQRKLNTVQPAQAQHLITSFLIPIDPLSHIRSFSTPKFSSSPISSKFCVHSGNQPW